MNCICGNIANLNCTGCRNKRYCSKACQIKDRPIHKYVCYDVSSLKKITSGTHIIIKRISDQLIKYEYYRSSTVINVLCSAILNKLNVSNNLVCGYIESTDNSLGYDKLRHTWIEIYHPEIQQVTPGGKFIIIDSIPGVVEDYNLGLCKYVYQTLMNSII